ncbi:Transcriptional regulator, contains XRE-family HTH domain [Microbispora rosea]|uniref:Transcriptional regulator, contains XRE-family HTH domain n=2 Tax=Microbispora TaxID=2005 RepID=A0A1N7HDH2_9ACTN|nr:MULTISPECIES: helix-turn-helix transcriptional regulator [Microbispora]TQS20731.1 helix-turn-helix transcriptional regulator [Microbispora hainanensis]GIH52647.1 transcriptional regulator [Microbispora rosea subsp. rosea]SIS22934.1 Transcriptional regulator, contains XRE-family HTH domain [Microbispora rosea]
MPGTNALGSFIKARRALVRPEDAGLPALGRRRVAGLRRDELAALAGVSLAYLTRLEQGRDRNPSEQVLDALGAALRLDADLTTHLHALARDASRPNGGQARRPRDRPAPGAGSLLDAWVGIPAYLRGRRFDVLAANGPAMALAPMYRPGRNLVRDVFLDPGARALFPQWGAVAAGSAAALRAGADLGDPALRELVEELSAASEDFRRLWERHDVRPTRDETKEFAHPVAGPLVLRRHSLTVGGTDGQVVIAYQAEPGTPSAAALARLTAPGQDHDASFPLP